MALASSVPTGAHRRSIKSAVAIVDDVWVNCSASYRLLGFVNTVRAAQGLDLVRGLSVSGADADDEERCALALAMGCAVGLSDDAAWAARGQWVVRFSGRVTAASVAAATGAPWLPDQDEVALPWDVADFAVAAHFGFVEADGSGHVLAWFVPVEDGRVMVQRLMPVAARESLRV